MKVMFTGLVTFCLHLQSLDPLAGSCTLAGQLVFKICYISKMTNLKTMNFSLNELDLKTQLTRKGT